MGGGLGRGGDFLAKLTGHLQENTGTDTQREEGSDGKKNTNQELSFDDCIGNVALWLQVILLINFLFGNTVTYEAVIVNWHVFKW